MTISISIYPLLGGWRAECKTCGAYGTSGTGKYKSEIGEALENLAKNQNTFSDKSKKCQHNYGNYKPRVNCFIDYKHLPLIKETVFNSGPGYKTEGCEQFPAILLDNTYRIDVINANVDHNWSSYSYVRWSWLQEQEQRKKILHKQELDSIAQTCDELSKLANNYLNVPEIPHLGLTTRSKTKFKYLVLTLFILSLLLATSVLNPQIRIFIEQFFSL